MGGGAGAGSFFGGLLGGVGQGLAVRRERQDKIKRTAFEGALKQINDLANDPNFSRDPEAIQDLSNASLSVIADYAGKGEVTGKGKPSLLHPKGKTERMDPLTDAKQQIQHILAKTYMQTGTVGDPDAPDKPVPHKGPVLSPDEVAAIGQKIAVKKQAALAQQKRVDDQAADDAAAKEADKLGLVGDQRLEFIAQHKITPTPKDNTTERQEWVDAKGESHTTYRSPGTGKVVDEDTNAPVDLAQKKLKEGWKAAQKETPDVAPLRSKEERLKVEHPDWPADKVKIEAAKALDKEEADKAKNAQTRLNITVQNAAQNSIPAKPEVTNYWANYIYGGGQIPYGELRNLGRKAVLDIMSMVPQIAAQRGETTGDLVARQSDVKALTASLNKMEPAYAATKAFEQTARANLDRAIGAASKIVDSGSPWINRPWREAEKELLGKPEYAAFHAARVVAFTEVSKVLNNPQGSGAVSDSARKEAEGALGEGATLEQLQAAADILKQDMTSRITAMEDTIKATKARIAGGASAPGGGKGEDKEYNGHTYHRDNPGDSWKLVK